MEIVSGVVRLEGRLDRKQLEAVLPDFVRQHQVLRLKGRVWFENKTLPLQLQMVGPRLNSWFEQAPAEAWHPTAGSGIDLVVLSFQAEAASSLATQLQRLVKATPITASKAAMTPER